MTESTEQAATETPTDGPPSGTPLFSAGTARLAEWQQMRRDPLGLLESLRAGGDIVHLRMGPRNSYLLIHPDYVKDALVTNHRRFKLSDTWDDVARVLGNGLLHSEGEFHRRQRRLSNPAFHHARIMEYATVMAEFAKRTSDRWQDGVELNIHDEMMELTLGVVCKTLFSVDIESDEARDFRDVANRILKLFRLGTPLAAVLRSLPLETTKKFDEAREVVDRFVYRIIRERRQSGEDRGDLLSMLMMARDEETDGSGMDDEQLRDESMTIIAAGHETTANALTWTWYELSQHPEAEARLHEELATVLGGRLPTVEDLKSLPYTRKVLQETMRLWPPAWILLRQVKEDHEIAGVHLPADTHIAMFPYLLHRDPRWWPEPARFDPDRWTDQAEQDRPKFAYMPFGAGPRMCIGEQFAWMEAMLIVAVIAQQWQVRMRPGHRVVPEPRVNLRPRNGIPMIPERRG
jgi:cytochrome P450